MIERNGFVYTPVIVDTTKVEDFEQDEADERYITMLWQGTASELTDAVAEIGADCILQLWHPEHSSTFWMPAVHVQIDAVIPVLPAGPQ